MFGADNNTQWKRPVSVVARRLAQFNRLDISAPISGYKYTLRLELIDGHATAYVNGDRVYDAVNLSKDRPEGGGYIGLISRNSIAGEPGTDNYWSFSSFEAPSIPASSPSPPNAPPQPPQLPIVALTLGAAAAAVVF